MPIWAYEPDWKHGFMVTYEYKTEVITSRRGNEQRISHREVPRISYEFSCVMSGRPMRRLMSELSVHLGEQWIMPIWNRMRGITSEFSGTTFTLSNNEPAFMPGGDILFLWGEHGNVTYELCTIDTRSGRNITLTTAPSRTIPSTAKVYPVTKGHLNTNTSLTALSDRTASIKVTFDVDPSFETIRSVPDATVFYDDREIVLMEPNWTNPLSIEYSSPVEVLDYGVGIKTFFDPRPFTDRVTKAEFMGADRPEADMITDVFRRARGRLGEFYAPTFTEDMRLVSGFGPSDRTLQMIGGQGLSDHDLSLVYRRVAFIFHDGSIEVRNVVDIDTSSGGAIITVDLDFGYAVEPSMINMICWVPLCRFASDSLVIEWQSDQVANIAYTTKALEVLGAET